ncbi:Fatty acid desaturase [Chromohalobacter canadensis]|uniref:Fatty acid desaturase n=1 Tax=Chromohalobacter canadensis TaxID=141389 RepID=A0A285VWI4_9GAMM|nr:fatty acid desaturase family protein [Chromohalobacter canadensis]SOC58323.1 Fatty acid desaturase [Chromohalobacter canadensis]
MSVNNKIFRLTPEVSKKLKPLAKKSNFWPLISISGAYLTIAISIFLTLNLSWWLYPIALVLIGSTQRGMANLLHESSHGTLAKSTTLNHIFGTTLTGHLIFHMLASYKESHIENHHPGLGDRDQDPDYQFHLEMGLYEHEKESTLKFFVKNIFLSLFGFRTFSYVKYVVKDRLLFKPRNKEERNSVRIEKVQFYMQWMAIIAMVSHTGTWTYLFLFWFVPMFTTTASIGWIIELAEHYPLPESETHSLLLSRNRHGWAFENWLLGRYGDNYHLVHHLRPNIPHHNVAKAHKIMLEDPEYKKWDDLWGGILTRKSPERMTLIDYVRRYKRWLREDPTRKGGAYAQHVIDTAYENA